MKQNRKDKRRVQVKKCLRCRKKFSTKPKKNKITGQYEEEDYCAKCRHLKEKYKQKKVSDRIRIRVLNKKVDLRMEVETLRRLEIYNPRLIEKLRREDK